MDIKPHSLLFQQQALWQLMHADVREIVFQEDECELRFFIPIPNKWAWVFFKIHH